MRKLFNELCQLMINYSFKPEKKLAQYFLVDEKVIAELINAAKINKSDVVVEIGAGCGFITKQLIKKCKKVIAYEIDEKLKKLLLQEFRRYKNFELRGDFLKEKELRCDKLVSSLPYNISLEIMYKLFRSNFKIAALIVDDEFAEKLISVPGMHNYIAVSVLSQYFFNIKILHDIPKDCFFPIPKTNSKLIVLRKKHNRFKAKNEKRFIEFVKALFCFKNKNLKKALSLIQKNFGKIDVNKTGKLFRKFINEKVMLLEVNDFVKVFNTL